MLWQVKRPLTPDSDIGVVFLTELGDDVLPECCDEGFLSIDVWPTILHCNGCGTIWKPAKEHND